MACTYVGGAEADALNPKAHHSKTIIARSSVHRYQINELTYFGSEMATTGINCTDRNRRCCEICKYLTETTRSDILIYEIGREEG